MSYNTQQDILDFVEDNNVKFVRFAFCDIFGTQKNIAVLASDLPKAMEDGVCFDGSSIAGFMKVEESDLVLRPDLSTVTILPWRPTEGRVMQFFCDVEKPDGAAFGGNCRGFLRQMSRSFRKLGLTCNVGAECEFYLFENDDRGRPTRIPIDFGGYFDVAPLDAGEHLRRDDDVADARQAHDRQLRCLAPERQAQRLDLLRQGHVHRPEEAPVQRRDRALDQRRGPGDFQRQTAGLPDGCAAAQPRAEAHCRVAAELAAHHLHAAVSVRVRGAGKADLIDLHIRQPAHQLGGERRAALPFDGVEDK